MISVADKVGLKNYIKYYQVKTSNKVMSYDTT